MASYSSGIGTPSFFARGKSGGADINWKICVELNCQEEKFFLGGRRSWMIELFFYLGATCPVALLCVVFQTFQSPYFLRRRNCCVAGTLNTGWLRIDLI